jgi:hypothetical protein
MEIEVLNVPFEHIIINDIYTKEELYLIWRETDFLFNKLGGPDKTNAATEEESELRKKSGKGIFLDNVYTDRSCSDLLNITRKIFHNEEIRESMRSTNSSYFKLFDKTNWDSTLLQYYDDGDYYKSHTDESVFTAIYTYYKSPKNFTGGDLMFGDYEYCLPIQNNQLILFPSLINHEVSQVTMKNSEPMSGRFSIANLIFWKL